MKVSDVVVRMDGRQYRVVVSEGPSTRVLAAPDFHWSDDGYGRELPDERWMFERFAEHKVPPKLRKALLAVLEVAVEHHNARSGS